VAIGPPALGGLSQASPVEAVIGELAQV